MIDGTGYDYQPGRLHRLPRRAPRYAAVVVGVVLAVTGMGWAATRPTAILPAGPEHAHPQPAPTRMPSAGRPGTPAATSPGTATPPRPVRPGSVGSSGGDGVEVDIAPAAATATVRTFLAGWLTRTDPDRRARLLQASAAAGLAAELALTDPAAIPAGPVESLVLVGASATSVEYRVTLPNTTLPPVTVDVIAAADPQAPHGWYVVSIRQDR